MSATTFSPRSGLTWTVLRLHRGSIWLWALYVAVTAGLLLWAWGPGTSGLGIIGVCSPKVATGCVAEGDTAGAYHYVLQFTDVLVSFLPAAAAVYAGGTLIGQELERGTAQLMWTQSVSPVRWLTTKLVLPALLLVAGTGVLVLLRRAVAAQTPHLTDNQWFTGSPGALSPVVMAMPLLGLACGALAALLKRRALTSAVIGLVLTVALGTLVGLVRSRLWPTETVFGSVEHGYPGFVGEVVSEGAVTGSGAHVADPMCGGDRACLVDHNVTGFYTEGHPPSHFWPLQLVETGLVLALTAAVVALTYRTLRKRVAV
ncbi:ABC transporter permease [Streptomyces sp. KL116D]|uniref:ABC transporter permease n=1 Tax=Streptomyces sp. KL116D TaxID=3045152 RepID=UPI003558F116